MANHCIDVVCLGCGKQWCLRGCGFDHPPDVEKAEKARRRHKIKPGYEYGGVGCCPSFPVVSDSILYGDDPEAPKPKTLWERLDEDLDEGPAAPPIPEEPPVPGVHTEEQARIAFKKLFETEEDVDIGAARDLVIAYPRMGIEEMIRWRDSLTDQWGEDLISLIVGMGRSDRNRDRRMPEYLWPAWEAFRAMPSNERDRIAREVLNVPEGSDKRYSDDW